MTNKRVSEETGKAYAFFDCPASKGAVEAELPTIRRLAQTPSQMELYLTEDITSIRCDDKIRAIAREAKDAGLRYAIAATLPRGSNERTANELADIMNVAYASPLYPPGKFRRHILYEESGNYIERE
jgi:hypothetical protein